MKNASQSMTPDEAACAFFGQDDASFAKRIAELTKNDPRLERVFKSTRNRLLDKDSGPQTRL
jgi:hypothetical protein